jgi:uncharacterized protein with ACT and thioredoxin-like domain
MVTIDASLDELTGATIIIIATTTDPRAASRRKLNFCDRHNITKRRG